MQTPHIYLSTGGYSDAPDGARLRRVPLRLKFAELKPLFSLTSLTPPCLFPNSL